jgi:hypothetical protein
VLALRPLTQPLAALILLLAVLTINRPELGT